ncbi:MAG TPA: hypothetical protein VFU82_00170 [Gammaproteobacteria bacterium]|jgi:hypothetical protein|nr:hypothetical protein [Gammaproteobacteria bacterium]
MWLQRLTHYLFKNPWQALAVVFVTTFVPVIGVFGILFAALVTLRKGALAGLALMLAATLPYLGSLYFTEHHEAAIPFMVWAAVGVAMVSNVLTYGSAVMLQRQAGWGTILQSVALLGVLLISVVHLAYPNVSEWWLSTLTTYYTEATAAVSGVVSGAAAPSDVQLDTLNVSKYYATGMMVAAVLLNAIMQLIVARWWQSAVFQPGILRRELHAIRLSKLASVLFLLSLGLSYWGNSVVLDIMPVLYILFSAAGLSVIHYMLSLVQASARLFWLSLVYVILILALPTSLVLLAMVALLDTWFDIRTRFGKV